MLSPICTVVLSTVVVVPFTCKLPSITTVPLGPLTLGSIVMVDCVLEISPPLNVKSPNNPVTKSCIWSPVAKFALPFVTAAVDTPTVGLAEDPLVTVTGAVAPTLVTPEVVT